jgi:hypothetical protein
MNAYVQLMGGKHKVVIIMPAGQRVTLQPAYSSKASAEQATKTWGLTLVDGETVGREVFVGDPGRRRHVR